MTKKASRKKKKHSPQRMCVVCREHYDKRQLTRIVNTKDGGVKVDPTGKMNGRGAYLCPKPACWNRAVMQESLLNQALKCELEPKEREEITAFKPVADLVKE